MDLFLFFLSFAPNLLRKAVKVEGSQEGIVGTKHSPEQLDFSYQNSHSTDTCSPHFFENPHHQRADRCIGSSFCFSFEALFCCVWISCTCVTSTWVKGIAWFWGVICFSAFLRFKTNPWMPFLYLCLLFKGILYSWLSVAEFMDVFRIKLQLLLKRGKILH